MRASAREISRPAARHFSQNSRSRSSSAMPARPRRTTQPAIRTMSASFMGPRSLSDNAVAEVTSGQMTRSDRSQKRRIDRAKIGLHRAARIEMAARRRVERACDLAFGFGLGDRGGGAMERVGDRGNQRARIGMA